LQQIVRMQLESSLLHATVAPLSRATPTGPHLDVLVPLRRLLREARPAAGLRLFEHQEDVARDGVELGLVLVDGAVEVQVEGVGGAL